MNMEADQPIHIMVVEDDESLAAWIADYLNSHEYQVSVATRGDDALELIRADDPDLVVLDVMLPGLTGLEVCEQAREFYSRPRCFWRASKHCCVATCLTTRLMSSELAACI